jgi:hypothetical protein
MLKDEAVDGLRLKLKPLKSGMSFTAKEISFLCSGLEDLPYWRSRGWLDGKGKKYSSGEIAKAWILSRFSPLVGDIPDTLKGMGEDMAIEVFNRIFSGDEVSTSTLETKCQMLAEAMANASIARSYLEQMRESLQEFTDVKEFTEDVKVSVMLVPKIEVVEKVEEAEVVEKVEEVKEMSLSEEVSKLKEVLGKLNKRSLQTGIKFFWFDEVLKNQNSFVVSKLRFALENKLQVWKDTDPHKRKLLLDDVHSIRGAGWKRLV